MEVADNGSVVTNSYSVTNFDEPSTSFELSDTSSDNDSLVIPVDHHRDLSFHSEKGISASMAGDFPGINLTELLSKAPMGKKILSHYERKQILSLSLRNKLVDIIFTDVFNFHYKQ